MIPWSPHPAYKSLPPSHDRADFDIAAQCETTLPDPRHLQEDSPMISNRVLSLTVPLLFVFAGCTKGGGATAASSDAASDAKGVLADGATSAAARPPIRPFRHAGLGGLALNAAHEAQLTDEQVTSIEKIQQQFAAGDGAARTTYQDYQSHVAAGVRSGKFDATQLHADYAAFDTMRKGEQDREAEALNALHALLTPEQRTTVATAVRTRQSAVDGQKAPEMPDGGISDHAKQTLARMTQDLTLDTAQQKRVADLLSKDERTTIASFPLHKEEQKRHVEAFLASFEQPDFDAKALDNPDAGAKPAHEQMEKEVGFLTQLVTILKPEQREKLAAQRAPGGQMPRHPMGPGMMGPGGPPMGGPGMGPNGPATTPNGPGAPMPPGHP